MTRYVCPNVTCRKTGCYEHCNHCGESIIWRPPLLDKEIAYAGPKPLKPNGQVHRCMLEGTKDGRYYKTPPTSTQNYYTKVWYTPEQILAMRDPIKVAAWDQARNEWLDKWEGHH